VVTIVNQRALQAVRKLPFCHACGRSFESGDLIDHDHVPSQSCFDKSDRNPPLKLRTHAQCNNAHKLNDEKLGQLIAAQRHKAIDPNQTKLRLEILRTAEDGRCFAYFNNLDLNGAIRRWVGGFHAALYREPLLPGIWFHATPPLPLGEDKDGTIRVETVPKQHLAFVEALKSNRTFGNVDSVVTCSGKMRYECLWAEADGGDGLFCIFGLDMYGWIGLGDGKNFGARGCTGAYIRPSRTAPASASIATRLVVPFENRSPYDPFGV
jgi:hypothetical protein